MKWTVWETVSETSAFHERVDRCITNTEECLSREEAENIADSKNGTSIRHWWEVRPGLPDNPRLKQVIRDKA